MIDRLAGELDRLAKVTAWDADDDLVFAHPGTGKPLDRSKVLKRFKMTMKKAGLGDRLGEGGITFHSLRHTFGTQMAAQGVPMRTLQELLGHRDFATTLIYADYAPSAHESEWAEAAFARSGPVNDGYAVPEVAPGSSLDRQTRKPQGVPRLVEGAPR